MSTYDPMSHEYNVEPTDDPSWGAVRRFAVTGGRDYTDRAVIADALAVLSVDRLLMVNGDCPTGADAIAKELWEERGGKVELHPADWNKHGKAAGPLRNQQMVDSGLSAVIVFDGGRGTADMRLRCIAAGIRIIDRRTDRAAS